MTGATTSRVVSRQWEWARWLALLPFAIALVVMLGADPAVRWACLGWSIVSLAAAALLVSQLDEPPARTLWAWSLLALFAIGFHLQTALAMALGGDVEALAVSIGRDLDWVTPAVAAAAYGWIGVAFAIVCTTAAALLWAGRQRPIERQATRDVVDGAWLVWLVVGAAVAAALLAAVRFQLDIGVLGRERAAVPWRLDTVIFRSQSHLLPALLVYAIWASEAAGRTRLAIAAGATLFAHQVIVSLLSTSKAGLVWFALPLLFLWLCDDRMTKRRVAFVALVLSGLVLAYPVSTWLRFTRVWAPKQVALVPAERLEAARVRARIRSTPQEIARRLVVRVNGAAGVWFTMRAAGRAGGLDRLWPDRDVPLVRYYTRDVCGVTAIGDFRQPGFVGSFLIAGGSRGAPWLWAAFVAAVAVAWRAAGRLRTAAVVRAVAGVHLLVFVNEGTLQWQDLVAAAACVALIVAAHRVLSGWLVSPPLPAAIGGTA